MATCKFVSEYAKRLAQLAVSWERLCCTLAAGRPRLAMISAAVTVTVKFHRDREIVNETELIQGRTSFITGNQRHVTSCHSASGSEGI